MVKVAPSVLNADFEKKESWLKEFEEAKIDRIHWDIMDNKYVPNKGVAKEKISELRPFTKFSFESHLMVENPEEYVEEFADAGNNSFIFHIETTKKPLELIKKIRTAGMKAGICINNKTSVNEVIPFLNKIDLVLVMSVEAGFGGQKFNSESIEKISVLRKKIDSEAIQCEIEVDGGINAETGKKVVEAGANVLVAGTAVFKHSQGIKFAINELQNL